jgi:hypothetical protein
MDVAERSKEVGGHGRKMIPRRRFVDCRSPAEKRRSPAQGIAQLQRLPFEGSLGSSGG